MPSIADAGAPPLNVAGSTRVGVREQVCESQQGVWWGQFHGVTAFPWRCRGCGEQHVSVFATPSRGEVLRTQCTECGDPRAVDYPGSSSETDAPQTEEPEIPASW